MDSAGLATYLESIVKGFVESREKVVVISREFDRKIVFDLSIAEIDLPVLENVQFTYRALNHIMNRVTQANLGKSGSLNDQFEITR